MHYNKIATVLVSLLIIFSGTAIIFGLPTDDNSIPRDSGGTDAWGYTWIDSKAPSPSINYDWIEINATGTDSGVTGDDNSGSAPIGFNFPFYENTYSGLNFSTNGYLDFGSDHTDYSNDDIPDPTTPNNYIAPFWDDLTNTEGTIYYEMIGSAPNRQFIVQWEGLIVVDGIAGPLKFQTVLNETGEIWINYHSLGDGDSGGATVGIENSTGEDGLVYSYNDGSAITDSMSILFAPGNYNVNLSPNSQSDTGNIGTSIWYPINVENTGSLNDTYNLTVSDNNWNTTIYDDTQTSMIDSLKVNAGSNKDIYAKVDIPSNANFGDKDDSNITAESQNDTGETDTSRIITEVKISLDDAPWPMFRQDHNHTGLSPYNTSGNTGAKLWEFSTGGSIFSSPAVADLDGDGVNEVYVGSYDGYLYSIYTNNGSLNWKYYTGNEIRSSPALADADNDGYPEVYFGCQDGYLYCLNYNGTFKWRYSHSGWDTGVWSSPTVIDTNDDGLKEIYVAGYYLWQTVDIVKLDADGSVNWTQHQGGRSISSPALWDGDGDGAYEMYLPNNDFSDGGEFHIYNSTNGNADWTYAPAGYDRPQHSSPVIAGDIDNDGSIEVIVGNRNDNLYVFHGEGDFDWSYTTGDDLYTSPAIADTDENGEKEIIFGSCDSNLYSLRPDGTKIWNYSVGDRIDSSPSVGSDGSIYFGSDDSNVYALNPNGTLKWNYTTGDIVRSSPAIDTDGSIYIGSYDGKLYKLGTPGNYSVDVTPENSIEEGDKGEYVWQNLTLTNRGNNDDTYDLTVTGNNWATEIYDSSGTSIISSISIQSGSLDDVCVKVHIPVEANYGTFDLADIYAKSQNETSVEDTSQIKTRVWVDTQLITTLTDPSTAVKSCRFNKVGNLLAVGSEDNNAYIYDTSSYSSPLQILSDATDYVNSVEWHPTGNYLATSSRDGYLRVYDTTNWDVINTLNNGRAGSYSLTWRYDGNYLIGSNNLDDDFPIFNTSDPDPNNWYEVRSISESDCSPVSYAPNGTWFVGARSQTDSKIYDASSPNPDNWFSVGTINDNDNRRGICIGDNGHFIFSEDFVGNEISIFRRSDLSQYKSYTTNNTIYGIDTSPNLISDINNISSGIVVGGQTSGPYDIEVWNIAEDDTIEYLSGHTNEIYEINFKTDGSEMASGSLDGTVKIWSTPWAEVEPEDHDLDVSDIDAPSSMDLGNSTLVNGTISNIGNNSETNIQVDLVVEGVIENSTTIPSLDPSNSTIISLGWTPSAGGIYTVGYHVVPVPGENITYNNWLNTSVEVIAHPDIWVSPHGFDFTLTPGEFGYDNLTIGNDGIGELDFYINYQSAFDDFPTAGSFNSDIWDTSAISGTPEVDDVGTNEPSPPYSMRLNGDGDTIPSITYNTTYSNKIDFSFWYELGGGGESPDSGDEIALEYYSNGGLWNQVWTVAGDSTNHNTYQHAEASINSSDAFHENFRYRFRSWGSGSGFDDFFVDDVYFNSSASTWITVTPDNGTVSPNAQTNVTLIINTSTLDPGYYHTNLSIQSNDPDEDPILIPVNLTVLPPPEVIETTPVDDASGVSVSQKVVVTFNKSMDTGITPDLKQTNGTDPGGWFFLGWSSTNISDDTVSWAHNDWDYNDDVEMEVSNYTCTDGVTGDPYRWNFTTVITHDISLTSGGSAGGWNFVSFKLILYDNSLVNILDDPDTGISPNYDKVMYYSAEDDDWKTYVPGRSPHYNDLHTWDRTMGIWIHMTADDTLSVQGYEPTNTTITLYSGWNMVGYPSDTNRFADTTLPSEISKMGIFNEYAPYNIEYVDRADFGTEVLSKGNAYWLYNEEGYAVNWTIDYQ